MRSLIYYSRGGWMMFCMSATLGIHCAYGLIVSLMDKTPYTSIPFYGSVVAICTITIWLKPWRESG